MRGSDEQEYSLGGICAKTSQKYSISGVVVLYADAPCVFVGVKRTHFVFIHNNSIFPFSMHYMSGALQVGSRGTESLPFSPS